MRVRAYAALFLPIFLIAGSCEGGSERRARKRGGGTSGTSGEAGASGTAGASAGAATGGRGGATGGRGGASGTGGAAGAGIGGDAGAGAGGESAGGDSGNGGSAGESGTGNGGSSAGEAGAGGAGGDSCMPVTITSTLRPSAIVIMFDRSLSMVQDQTPPTRWDLATAGLRQFLTDPASAGLGVGLRLYPHDLPAAGCASLACNAAACAELLFPVTRLTLSEGMALSGLVESYPPLPSQMGGGTPTSVAVEGALAAAQTYATAHPLQKTSVVFVTDRDPNGCNHNFTEIAAPAGTAFSTSWIRTYAIGLGDSPFDFLNQLASAGGTAEAFLLADGPTLAIEFSAALGEIRASSAGCDLPFPVAPQRPVDPEFVRVERVATGGARTPLVRMPSAVGCGMVPGWYYDAGTASGRIVLCPSGCDAAAVDPGLSFEIVMRCPS